MIQRGQDSVSHGGTEERRNLVTIGESTEPDEKVCEAEEPLSLPISTNQRRVVVCMVIRFGGGISLETC